MSTVTKQFYLVGDDPSTARSIEVDSSQTLKSLQEVLGDEFHIIQPSGISFQTADQAIETVAEVAGANSSIGISVDGMPVREPDGPPPLPIVGNFYEIYPDHLGNHDRLFRKYGSVIKTVNNGKVNYLTNDPVVAGYAFSESPYFTKGINSDHPLFPLKDNNTLFLGDTETENFRLSHKFVPPCLSPKAVRHYTPLMQQCVRESFKVFDAADEADESWNVYQYMLKLGSQTVGKFSLGLDFGHFDSRDAPLHRAVKLIAETLVLNKKLASRGAWYGKLPFGDPARLRSNQQEMYGIIHKAMNALRDEGAPDLPLHDAALQASCAADYLARAVDETGAKLSEQLAFSNLVVVTGAGFTTTSSLLSWLIYSMVTYPGEQDRLLQELVDHDVNSETNWETELIQSLTYLDKFVKETQRIHNPSYQPGRTTKQEVIIPGGYRLPADKILIPALYAIQTNPDFWDSPLRFDTSRWDPAKSKDRHRCAYLPFATGPRGCIGFNFALQEVKVLLPELLYRYEFSRASTETIEYDPEFQLIRPLNFYVRARKRTVWPEKSK
ncbi:hypothetical protein V502_03782 [Pseudogymnoascus sp. VKM F-4520 (FW-2644)]|nr:hypothetical protein V502_03782 [Pseudogymnoascus sp. VKM F-4520 (FW-2644)]